MARINKHHTQELADLITPLDTESRRAAYISGDFPRADKVKDLNKRYRWDLFWVIRAVGGSEWIEARYAEGCNDSHIDTALRSIVRPL